MKAHDGFTVTGQNDILAILHALNEIAETAPRLVMQICMKCPYPGVRRGGGYCSHAKPGLMRS